ncbi:hypothetical protein [Winogradskyella aurantiaca]|uniref:hypothetical protein n=1 Tax=Winogradskyella aurantiaca TaxID=2219558 RepID=UPI000E1D9CB7|nr:hypothetical protein [Winogradskyella aurantiaca]
MRQLSLWAVVSCCLLLGCSGDSTTSPPPEPRLIIRLNFDPDQERLNNLGQPARILDGNAAQSPSIQRMSAHYVEFAPTAFTPLGDGTIIYQGPETSTGGTLAIDFREAFFAGDDGVFINVALDNLIPGEYEWVRVSLSYQEGDIQLLVDDNEITGRLASFVGYNTYISSFDLNQETFEVNDDKLQGYWAFEALGYSVTGQAQPGATTVPNPLFETSPIPQGSCVVTGAFEEPLVITGEETQDITVTLSFSVNQSFEWTEVIQDGKYEPGIGEQVVDMGLRGLIPTASN